ncbi:hypothetical protein [Aeromicrobium duanguangcaii]|uniref:Uncharacterized protein n=1 Tax=Aeromicrobium duanguangcaii TaxID=2968086 RepID=A0ABY5KJW9_9ACTN|nr:hypothetical protein [Aeromicrobium duanguangcaii]MCD9153123.1 hypothetical protein [Aeromicrobium duanguangcaii]UUI69776.1 hypothetical protein NP095_06695 [Aeromicrobium duanguangcaii]
MSDARERIARADRWWQQLPGGSRPDYDDVETCARLGVEDQSALSKLVLGDTGSLVTTFPTLRRILDATESDMSMGDSDPAGVDTSQVASTEHALEEAQQTVEPSGGGGIRERRVREYVSNARSEGSWHDHLDDDWVARALEDPEALAKMPVSVARKHRRQLQGLLDVGVGGRRTEEGTAEDFTTEPDLTGHLPASHAVVFEPAADDGVILSWPEADSTDFAWFKVFAGDGTRRPLGYEGRLVGQGHDSSVQDMVPVAQWGRKYAVWVHAGANKSAAKAAQPCLWARGVLVAPVRKVHLSSGDRRVAATWTAETGVDRVEVHRFDVGSVPEGRSVSAASVVSGDLSGSNLTGFEENDVPAGTYLYRFYAVALVDDVEYRSVPVEEQVTVQVQVPEVHEIDVTVDDVTGRLTASWQEIQGVHVELHWTDQELVHGVRDHQLDKEGLERLGLGVGTRINTPPTREDGRATVSWDWPGGASRIQVVAVSTEGTAYRVGAAEVRVRLGRVTHLALHERVDEQYLTFAWPEGASAVVVRMQGNEAETDPWNWREIREIDRASHRRYGGIRLGELPAEGCRLALMGYAVEGGRQVQGDSEEIEYPGLYRIRYRFESGLTPQPAASRFWKRREKNEVAAAEDWIHVECEPPKEVDVVLVTMPDRLPLHGSALAGEPRSQRLPLSRLQLDGAKSTLRWKVPAGAGEGWRRLFVDLPDEEQARYAVIDPEVAQLRGRVP